MKQQISSLHIDIMDGSYVPNFTMGADLAYGMYEYSKIPLDFHLMVDDVDRSYHLFTKITGSNITIHPETSKHPIGTIQSIKKSGCKAGIAIDPAISLETLKHILPFADTVCLMTVNPGFSGQKLLPFCIDKIEELYSWRETHECDFKIEVDGNVSWKNIPLMIEAGADILVLGSSSIFTKNHTLREAFVKLRNIIKAIPERNQAI